MKPITTWEETAINIKNKVVVITGAGSGIGCATALLLASRGANVVLGGRREAQTAAVAAKITSARGQAIYLSTDVTKRDQVEALVKLAQEHYGQVNVLIHNAGLGPISRFDALKVDDWNGMIDVDFQNARSGAPTTAAGRCLPDSFPEAKIQSLTFAAPSWFPDLVTRSASVFGDDRPLSPDLSRSKAAAKPTFNVPLDPSSSHYPDLKRAVVRLWRQWLTDKVIIEDAGSGKSLAQDFRVQGPFRPLLWRVTDAKEERFVGCLGEIEAGLFLLPKTAPWLAIFRSELRAFPSGRHDDQVDSMTQFVKFEQGNWRWTATAYDENGRARATNRMRKRPY